MVVVLGKTGRNFGAGMTGGVAYGVRVSHERMPAHANTQLVCLRRIERTEDQAELRADAGAAPRADGQPRCAAMIPG